MTTTGRALAELRILLPFLITGAANALLIGDGTLYLLHHLLGADIVVSTAIVVAETSVTDYFWKVFLVFRARPGMVNFLGYQGANAVSFVVQLVATPALVAAGLGYLYAYPAAVFLGWMLKYLIVRPLFRRRGRE